MAQDGQPPSTTTPRSIPNTKPSRRSVPLNIDRRVKRVTIAPMAAPISSTVIEVMAARRPGTHGFPAESPPR